MPPQDPAASVVLFELLKEKRQDLIDRWLRTTRLEGTATPLSTTELLDRIPRFIDELIVALYPDALPLPALGETAVEHGAQRLRMGFNVGEVVREYGILHRCILDIADEAQCPIGAREHRVIAKWLNAGIASAVSQYVSERDTEVHRHASEHLAFIAHEVRNPLSSARMAFEILRRGDLVGGGRAVDLLNRNLRRIVEVIDNALSHASMRMGVVPRLERIPLRAFLDEIEFDGGAETEEKQIQVVVQVPDDLIIEADARLLRSAVANLFHNAVKFSLSDTRVTLRARRQGDQIEIEVEDGCGGLPPGRAEELFLPLVQKGADHSGFGLGLAIALQAVEAHGGSIRVLDLPGRGCVFAIRLPATSPATG